MLVIAFLASWHGANKYNQRDCSDVHVLTEVHIVPELTAHEFRELETKAGVHFNNSVDYATYLIMTSSCEATRIASLPGVVKTQQRGAKDKVSAALHNLATHLHSQGGEGRKEAGAEQGGMQISAQVSLSAFLFRADPVYAEQIAEDIAASLNSEHDIFIEHTVASDAKLSLTVLTSNLSTALSAIMEHQQVLWVEPKVRSTVFLRACSSAKQNTSTRIPVTSCAKTMLSCHLVRKPGPDTPCVLLLLPVLLPASQL